MSKFPRYLTAYGLKLAFALLWERKERCPDAFPVLAIHDEIVVEAPADKAEEAICWLVGAMEDGMRECLYDVPVEPIEAEVKEAW